MILNVLSVWTVSLNGQDQSGSDPTGDSLPSYILCLESNNNLVFVSVHFNIKS